MRQLYLLLICLGCTLYAVAQSGDRSARGGDRGGFSLSNLSEVQKEIPDSLLLPDSTEHRRIEAFRLLGNLGDRIEVAMDSSRLNYYNSTLADSKSLSYAYLANLGSPGQTRIFSERKEARDFVFADAYAPYMTTSENAFFYDTKVPYTNLLYTRAGTKVNQEEQLKGTLVSNFGKHLNIGADLDYIYSRGYYNSNGNKLLNYRFFGNYLTDKYEAHAYFGNFSVTNYENGGLTEDRYITAPEDFVEGKRVVDSKAFPVRFTDTWNHIKSKQLFFSHRYNLGFYREPSGEEADTTEVFIPVSSIIHTLSYEDYDRLFISNSPVIDTCYANTYNFDTKLRDKQSGWTLKNTVALAMREGFQDWVKLGFTAFVSFEKRRFKMPVLPDFDDRDNLLPYPQVGSIQPEALIYDQFSTYVGARISKQRRGFLTYNVEGELCVVGHDFGEFRAKGELKTTFPLFKKNAAITAEAHFKNLTPAFFLNHFNSRYFSWHNDFSMTQQLRVGAKVDIEQSKTQLAANVESIQNHVFIGSNGVPVQHDKNLQIITARLKQDFRVGILGWENEAAYQLSSNQEVLPLPDLSLYTNLFISFKIAKVLTTQIGADMRYHSAYYAPYYEPATQQFQTQSAVKVGNSPLINVYANFHLKQARFFAMLYNAGTQVIDPNYFSLAHYPLNPMILKLGVSVVFNN